MPYYSRRQRRVSRSFPVIPVVIAVLVIIAAIFMMRWIWSSKSTSTTNIATPAAQFTLTNGKARIILAGGVETSIEPSSTPTTLNVGESIETVGSTRLDLMVEGGTVVRMDGNTSLKLAAHENKDGKTGTLLNINKGNALIRTPAGLTNATTVAGRVSQLGVNSDSQVSVTRSVVSDTYRELSGSSMVRVLDTDGTTALSESTLAAGQQVVVTDSIVADLKARKVVQLAQPIDAEFKISDWGMFVLNGSTIAAATPLPGTSPTPSTSNNGPTITIISPQSGATLSSPTVTISGTASATTAKIYVDKYPLQKYVPGTANWNYVASLSNGNLLTGDNVYTIFAEDKDGNRGDPVTLQFTYSKNGNTNSTPTTTGDTTTGGLKAPTILGDKTITTSEAKLIIKGTVPTTAQKVVVNGFVLQKFVAGSGAFQYTASATIGTMNEGVNVYTVYYVDKAGNKSPATAIQITYKKGAASTGSGSTK